MLSLTHTNRLTTQQQFMFFHVRPHLKKTQTQGIVRNNFCRIHTLRSSRALNGQAMGRQNTRIHSRNAGERQSFIYKDLLEARGWFAWSREDSRLEQL